MRVSQSLSRVSLILLQCPSQFILRIFPPGGVLRMAEPSCGFLTETKSSSIKCSSSREDTSRAVNYRLISIGGGLLPISRGWNRLDHTTTSSFPSITSRKSSILIKEDFCPINYFSFLFLSMMDPHEMLSSRFCPAGDHHRINQELPYLIGDREKKKSHGLFHFKFGKDEDYSLLYKFNQNWRESYWT